MTRWIAPVLKEELMKDGCVRKDIDYDYYAYLLSLTEVIPVDCGTRKGLEMEEFFFLGYQYMASIYDSILRYCVFQGFQRLFCSLRLSGQENYAIIIVRISYRSYSRSIHQT
jgi:hypothetical protein